MTVSKLPIIRERVTTYNFSIKVLWETPLFYCQQSNPGDICQFSPTRSFFKFWIDVGRVNVLIVRHQPGRVINPSLNEFLITYIILAELCLMWVGGIYNQILRTKL